MLPWDHHCDAKRLGRKRRGTLANRKCLEKSRAISGEGDRLKEEGARLRAEGEELAYLPYAQRMEAMAMLHGEMNALHRRYAELDRRMDRSEKENHEAFMALMEERMKKA